MNKKALNTLEYNKIIQQLTSLAASPAGKRMCEKTLPMTTIPEIESAQAETAAALARIYKKGAPSFAGIKDITSSFLRLEVGSVLGAGELLAIASLLERAKTLAAYNEDTEDCLSEKFNGIMPLTTLHREITTAIISEEEISDDASSALRDIRRKIKSTSDKVHTELTSILNSKRTLLQDALITMRNGRYCLPVRADSRSSFPGMVHDQSRGGQTLFIEPLSVVKLNNEIKELENKELEEIEKILAALSEMAGLNLPDIKNDYEILTELDYIFARASLAKKMKASRPVLNKKGRINLKKARHPLIPSDKVVPINVYAGNGFKHLIITGPNTGGKTVTLKTVGLLTLMGQAGLHIPAFDKSELSVFNEVYADIGDEQSIEMSLSTFSSHMTNIVDILRKADGRSLVLFDELCTGTDPEEGAALAISILSNLLKRHVTVFATTHYSEIKLYAMSTEGVQNACCEFDVATLRPTYNLLIGIPGKSNAFAISKRLGLSEKVIKDARTRIDTDTLNFEDVISDIEASRIDIEQKQKEIDEAHKEIERLKKKLQDKNDRIDRAKEKILDRANEEARQILADAKALADETIRKFNKASVSGMAVADLERERSRLREGISERDKAMSSGKKKEKTKHKTVKPDKLSIGDSVKVISLGLSGTIISLPDQKGMVSVQMGILSSSVHISDLEPEAPKEEPKPTVKVYSGYNLSKAKNIKNDINLIGMTVDEALIELDKYLDDAYLSHLSQVTVIHGRGTGALKRAVHDHLRRVSYVKSFRIGEFGEGDHGVTIVEFKD